MKLTSCGFLIESGGLYLIGHSTQGKSNVDVIHDEKWTIPKGIMNDGETEIETAVRETLEETGINLPDYYDVSNIPLYMTITTKYKIIKVYHLVDNELKLFNHNCRCDSIINNKNMTHMNGLPEIDMFMWVSKETAEKMVFSSLKPLFLVNNTY